MKNALLLTIVFSILIPSMANATQNPNQDQVETFESICSGTAMIYFKGRENLRNEMIEKNKVYKIMKRGFENRRGKKTSKSKNSSFFDDFKIHYTYSKKTDAKVIKFINKYTKKLKTVGFNELKNVTIKTHKQFIKFLSKHSNSYVSQCRKVVFNAVTNCKIHAQKEVYDDCMLHEFKRNDQFNKALKLLKKS